MKIVAVYTTFCVADDVDDTEVHRVVEAAGEVFRESGILADGDDAYSVSTVIRPLESFFQSEARGGPASA